VWAATVGTHDAADRPPLHFLVHMPQGLTQTAVSCICTFFDSPAAGDVNIVRGIWSRLPGLPLAAMTGYHSNPMLSLPGLPLASMTGHHSIPNAMLRQWHTVRSCLPCSGAVSSRATVPFGSRHFLSGRLGVPKRPGRCICALHPHAAIPIEAGASSQKINGVSETNTCIYAQRCWITFIGTRGQCDDPRHAVKHTNIQFYRDPGTVAVVTSGCRGIA
jgi:hypothetical protein